MLKAIGKLGNRRTLFLGLSRENTRRLLDDQPIPIDLQALLSVDEVKYIQDIVIFAGETEAHCVEQLTKFYPEIFIKENQ